MFTKLQDFFAEYDFDFVLLFGSFVNGTTHELSDVDIGIYSLNDIKLQEKISLEDVKKISLMSGRCVMAFLSQFRLS